MMTSKPTIPDVLLACGELSERELVAVRWVLDRWPDVEALTEQLEALCKDRLSSDVFTRVADWLKDPDRKPAASAFTAGMERQICYALELDVLPYVKSLEHRMDGLMGGSVKHVVSPVRLDGTSIEVGGG